MANRIRELRQEKKITQLQLSSQLEVTQETISAYENNVHMPSLAALMKMSKIFNASMDYIMGQSNVRNIPKEEEPSAADIVQRNSLMTCYQKLGAMNRARLLSYAQGLVDADGKVADMLRRSKKPIVLVVNKVDSFEKFMPDVYEFYNLGLGDPQPISAASQLGLGDMLDEVVKHFGENALKEEEDERPRIAIIGKPNVGKSSIINKLLGEDRVIVSNIAGTTRDAIDTTIKRNGTEYVFIDTAGLRRKNKIKEEIERYSIIRTVSAVERCNVAVLVIDATEGITDQDTKIAGIAHERGKGMIIAVNKWDAIEKNDKTMKKFTEDVREKLSYMPYAELLFISAETGQRLPKLFETIDMVIENHSLRVATGVLNEIMAEAVALNQPPSDKGKRLRLYYITQVSVKPPTFVIFVNDKELMHFSYTRYIENKIREAFGFKGTPLKFIIRERKEK